MSNGETVGLNLPLKNWVEQAKPDSVRYRDRQATHILLSAIGITPALKGTMLLKGGALMMLAFGSPRGTQDVDFSVTADPEPFASDFETTLNPALQRAANQLGYLDLICRVQRVTKQPRESNFETALGSALSITVAHAKRGGKEEGLLRGGQAIRVVRVDVSFKEPVLKAVAAHIDDQIISIQTYSVEDLIAEKLRALLQQVVRNRNRRQDVFDIAWLLRNIDVDDAFRRRTIVAFKAKADARNIQYERSSLDNPEVALRARRAWDTMRIELEVELPDFDNCFAEVSAFYRSLPW